LNSLGHAEDETNQEQKLNEYGEEVNKLWEKLMYLEVVIVDQIESITSEFERNMSELVTNFVETIQGFFSQIRDLENIQFERLQELCLTMLEKVLKGEVPEDFSDDLKDVTNLTSLFNKSIMITLIFF